nr:uncharacterized protein LOC124497258 [Dermatophagoides farinae]
MIANCLSSLLLFSLFQFFFLDYIFHHIHFMDNQLDSGSSSNFKHISLIPNYRALQILQEQSSKIDKILSSTDCDRILHNIAKESTFGQFRNSLKDVDKHIKLNSSDAIKNLNHERSKCLANELKQNFSLTPTEIVMVLNEMPKDVSFIELMFPGKFSKEQSLLLFTLIDQFRHFDDTSNDNNGQGQNEKQEPNIS